MWAEERFSSLTNLSSSLDWFMVSVILFSTFSPRPIFVTLKVCVSFYHKMGMDKEVENPRDPAGMVMEGTTARNSGRSWSLGPWEQKGKFEPDCGGSQDPERVPQLIPKGKVGSLEGMPKPHPHSWSWLLWFCSLTKSNLIWHLSASVVFSGTLAVKY